MLTVFILEPSAKIWSLAAAGAVIILMIGFSLFSLRPTKKTSRILSTRDPLRELVSLIFVAAVLILIIVIKVYSTN